MRPEYSFQTSFTVTVVRGSGFRPLLRPGSSCLGLVMVLASQDFDSGWFGGFSSQPWESPHRTPTRTFLLPCLGPLVPRGLQLAGRGSACREHAWHCTAATVPRGAQSRELHEPRAPPGGQDEEDIGALQVGASAALGPWRLPYWSRLLSSS